MSQSITLAAGTAAAHADTLAFRGVVRRVIELGPGLRRLVLGGPDLEHFGVPEATMDLRFKVIVPAEGSTVESIGRVLTPLFPEAPMASGGDPGWYKMWLASPVSERGVMRTYTVRALREEGGERVLDVDLVLHGVGPDGSLGEGCGPAAAWAASAAVGDVLHLLGPNRALTAVGYGGIDYRPGAASHLLLAGDETAAPALCSVLDALPRAARGVALIEVPEAGQVQPVAAPDGVDVRWLVRSPGQGVGSLLLPAVREQAVAWVAESEGCAAGAPATRGAEPEDVNVDEVTLWEAPVDNASDDYAWIAGEAGVIKEIRRHLVRDLGVDRTRIAFMGYWRQGRAGH